jgi:hypothetical protein
MHAVIDFAIPCRAASDFCFAPVPLDDEKVSRCEAPPLEFAFDQFESLDAGQVEAPALNVFDPQVRIVVLDRGSFRRLLNATSNRTPNAGKVSSAGPWRPGAESC